jgi:ATP-dependent DNA helicase HFM1/MER3
MLESSLHQNLLEHINSEIGLGAIDDMDSAKVWLRNSFLRQRVQSNPGHYHIGKSAGQSWEEKLDEMVVESLKKLKKDALITCDEEAGNSRLGATQYGDIMSKVGFLSYCNFVVSKG